MLDKWNVKIRRIHQIIVGLGHKLLYSINHNLGILLTYVAVPWYAVCVIFTNEILFYIKWETLKTMSVYFIFNYVWGVIYRIGMAFLAILGSGHFILFQNSS